MNKQTNKQMGDVLFSIYILEARICLKWNRGPFRLRYKQTSLFIILATY